jgi:hypothetical protein
MDVLRAGTSRAPVIVPSWVHGLHPTNFIVAVPAIVQLESFDFDPTYGRHSIT